MLKQMSARIYTGRIALSLDVSILYNIRKASCRLVLNYYSSYNSSVPYTYTYEIFCSTALFKCI